jgi:hypothetical protein
MIVAPLPPSPQTLLDSLYAQAAGLLNQRLDAPSAPADYEDWLAELFPAHVTAPLAPHHRRIWEWVWALERGVRPPPLVVLLARGGAKSTSAEMACVAVGARQQRRYALYISGTQKQADDHVGNIASMLESSTVARYYPDLSERDLNKFGVSKGWRHNRLRTSAGFTVDALGLDVDVRGIRLEENRPDLLILDDVDDGEDTLETVRKKIRIITQKILPAGSPDVATLFVQNVVHYESVAARLAGLASEEADFLAGREVIGPIPALVGFKAEKIPGTVRWQVTSGTPTWEGQNLETCQAQVDDWGIKAFRAEAQHERTPPEGQAFPEWDASVHVIEPHPIPDSWPRWRAIDYGYAVPFCCLWGARRPDGTIVIYRELYSAGWTASEQALRVRVLSAGETYKASIGDPAMWASTREGQRFKSVADQYRENGVRLDPATNDRLAGWGRLHEYLDWTEASGGSEMFPPRLLVFKSCANLIRTLPLLVKDDNRPEDVDTDMEDHAPDALRYLMMTATGSSAITGVLAKTVNGHTETPDKHVIPPHVSNASERAIEQAEKLDPRVRRSLAMLGRQRQGWSG